MTLIVAIACKDGPKVGRAEWLSTLIGSLVRRGVLSKDEAKAEQE